MLLSAVSVLVVAQSSSEIPEGLMNNPVHHFWSFQHIVFVVKGSCLHSYHEPFELQIFNIIGCGPNVQTPVTLEDFSCSGLLAPEFRHSSALVCCPLKEGLEKPRGDDCHTY